MGQATHTRRPFGARVREATLALYCILLGLASDAQFPPYNHFYAPELWSNTWGGECKLHHRPPVYSLPPMPRYARCNDFIHRLFWVIIRCVRFSVVSAPPVALRTGPPELTLGGEGKGGPTTLPSWRKVLFKMEKDFIQETERRHFLRPTGAGMGNRAVSAAHPFPD